MISSSILLLFYIALLLFFGYYTASSFLVVQNKFEVLAVTTTIGPATFIIVSNALSYVVQPASAFWITTGLLAIASIILYRKPIQQRPTHCNKPIWWLVCISILAGLAYARDPGSDVIAMTHLPLAKTIAEGNFPVMNVLNPWKILSYHYGPALWAAATTALTGISVTISYAIQPLFNAMGIACFGAAFGYAITKNARTAAWAGVLALGGGGLFWLNIWPFLQTVLPFVWQGEPVIGTPVMRSFTPIVRNMHANPLFMMLGHRPIALGAAFFFGMTYAISIWLFSQRSLPWLIAAVLYGAGLALAMETTLVATFAALGAVTLILVIIDTKLYPWQKMVPALCIFLGIVSLIVVTQGGILSTFGSDTGASSFAILFDGSIHYNSTDITKTVPIFSLAFVKDYGLPGMLFPVTLWYSWTRRQKQPVLLLLAVIACMHFIIPLFVRFLPRPHEMNRLFFIGISLNALIIGIVLHNHLLFETARWKRLIGYSALFSMLVSSAINLPVKLLFPTLQLEAASLLPQLPAATQEQQQAYEWVRNNTKLKDWFFMRPKNVYEHYQIDRTRFSTYTNRFIIGPSHDNMMPEKQKLFDQAAEKCDPNAAATLHIKYIIVDTKEQAEWFKTHCSQESWELRFSISTLEFTPRVYQLLLKT